MSDRPTCPVCTMEDLLERETSWECATCGHEWPRERVVVDANGHPLADGDAVTMVKDLKVKGSSSTLKAGTKIKKIRLVDPEQNADHDIDAKTPEGMGVLIKSKWVKKA